MLNDKNLLSSDCPRVVQDLDLTKPGLLEASAGTGKTFAIEHLILRLLLESADLNLKNILVLTFTEKATGELKDKIRQRIAKRLTQRDLNQDQQIRLKDAIANFDQASIFTIHGFCESILKKYAFENHDLFQNELEKNDALIYEEVLKEEMRSTWLTEANQTPESKSHFYEKVSSLKFGTKKTWDEVILKLAGEYNPLRGDVIEPCFNEAELADIESNILGITAEIAGLFPDLKNEYFDEYPFFIKYAEQSFDSKPQKEKSPQIMRAVLNLAYQFIEKNREQKIACILEFIEIATQKIVVRIFKEIGFAILLPNGQSESESFYQKLYRIVSLLDHLKRGVIQRQDTLLQKSFSHLKQTVIDLKLKSHQYKNENGILTFNDMIEKVWMALKGNQMRIQILRQDFKYCIVDEFQDTDPQQWEIFKEVFLDSDAKNPLYLIGDPKQAIYRFRGGDIYTYMDARKALYSLSEKGEAQGVGLETNFRSSQKIIEACNTIFSHSDWFQNLTANSGDRFWKLSSEPNPLGYVPVECGGITSQTVQDKTHVSFPVIIKDFSQKPDQKKALIKRENFNWIALEILKLMQNPENFMIPDKVTGVLRDIKWNDVCILVRTGTEKKQVYKHCLFYGIPVQMERHNGLFKGDAAGQILAVLEAIENPIDMSKQARALFTLFFRKNSDAPISALPSMAHPSIIRWGEYTENKKWPALFYDLLHRTGLLLSISELQNNEQLEMDFIQVSQNLTHMALSQNLTLSSLIQTLTELRNGTHSEGESDFHRENSEGEKVSLMTLHISKGLEFPVVFLTGFSNGISPKYFKIRRNLKTIFQLNTKDATSKKEHEEENENENRRLFYVALTRAKYKLYLPILPDNKGKTKYGPLGGFVADALRSAAQKKPDLFFIDSEWNDVNRNALINFKDFKKKNLEIKIPSLEIIKETITPLTDFSNRRRKLSSYSLLAKYGLKTSFEMEEGRIDKDESTEEIYAANTLPRGREIGNMFHEILEQLSFSEIGILENSEALLAQPKIYEIIQFQMQKHDIDPKWLSEISSVIWNTLNALLPDPSGGGVFKLSQVTDLKPEMEFLFPYSFFTKLNEAQGFFTGFIDLVFRYKGKYYFLDWKSNFIEKYDKISLEKSIRESQYDLQYKLYTIAINRWLKSLIPDFSYEQHFGGIYYLYLRGMRGEFDSTSTTTTESNFSGVYAIKPSLEEVENSYPNVIAAAMGNGEFKFRHYNDI